jgi:DNA-binding MarR family transcriptional regulator
MEDEDLRAGQALLEAIEVFTSERHTMPLQYFRTFIYVALHEGKTVREMAKELGQSPTVMSRHLLDIGDFNRHNEPGMGLVTYKSMPPDRREHKAFLTPQGKTMFAKVTRKLRKLAAS